MPSGGNPTRPVVLVVDDNEDLCELMARLVRLGGHDATCVTDGPAALETIRRSVPALVILDVMMPGMGGLDVLRTVRADPRLNDMPVVMCSAVSDPGVRQRALEMGAQEYLVKGQVSLEDVAALVARYASPPGGGGGGSGWHGRTQRH